MEAFLIPCWLVLPAPNNAVYNEGNRVAGVQQSWPRAPVTGRQWVNRKKGREGEAAGSNEQAAFYKEAAAMRGRQVGRRFCLGGPLLFWLHYYGAAMRCDVPPPPTPKPHHSLYVLSREPSHSSDDSPWKCCLIAPFYMLAHPKDSSTLPKLTPARLVCLSLLSFSPSSLSLWFRTELPIHHPVHRRHFPPDHPGDSVRLLEALQVRATLSSHSSFSLSPPLLWYWTEGMCD